MVPSHACGGVSNASSQNFTPTLCHQESVFELCRSRTIGSNCRPSVGPQYVPVRAAIDHGLDGEHVSWLAHALGLVLRVVRNVRSGMEQRTYAVSAVGGDHRAAAAVGHLGYLVAEVSVHRARPNQSSRTRQALIRGAHQVHGLRRYVSDHNRFVQIRVEAVVEHGYVEIYDVPVLKLYTSYIIQL